MAALHRTSRLALALVTSLLFSCACGTAIAAAGPRTEIKAIFRTSPTKYAVAQCSVGETQRFREQTTGTPGKKALKACEKEARLPEARATSAVVSHIRIRGWTATIHLRLIGNDLEGQILKVRLTRGGGRWKADEILGFFHLDRNKLIEAFRDEFSEPGDHVPAKYAACIYRRLRHGSNEEITGWLFGGSPQALAGLYGPCLPESS